MMGDHCYTSRTFRCFITVILNLKFVRKYTAINNKDRYTGFVKRIKDFRRWLVEGMMRRRDSGLSKRVVIY